MLIRASHLVFWCEKAASDYLGVPGNWRRGPRCAESDGEVRSAVLRLR